MKFTQQFLIILLFVVLGETTSNILPITIPGNILGMLLLLIALDSGIMKLSLIEDVSNALLSHLGIFFIPAGVSILTVLSIIQPVWLWIVVISVSSTVFVMISTALVVNFIRKKVYQS